MTSTLAAKLAGWGAIAWSLTALVYVVRSDGALGGTIDGLWPVTLWGFAPALVLAAAARASLARLDADQRREAMIARLALLVALLVPLVVLVLWMATWTAGASAARSYLK